MTNKHRQREDNFKVLKVTIIIEYICQTNLGFLLLPGILNCLNIFFLHNVLFNTA